MQTALSQLTNNITNQVATKQDVAKAINTINLQSSAQLQIDMQRIFSQYCDKILDRAYQEFKQQNAAMQQMNAKIDVVVKRSNDAEQRATNLQDTLLRLEIQLEDLTDAYYRLASQSIEHRAQQERGFAARTAFSGLYG
jgi:hypothetical protein